MKIEVTEADIANGIRTSAKQCAIALALRRYVRDDVPVAAGSYIVDFGHLPGRFLCAQLPSEAAQFIYDYDRHLPVLPTTFDVVIPKWALRDELVPAEAVVEEEELVPA